MTQDSLTSKTNPHTPGPWYPARSGHELIVLSHTAVRSGSIAVLGEYWANYPRDEVTANARLIAAAPELLELARRYASDCPDCNGTGRYLRSVCLPWIGTEARPGDACEKCADILAAIAKAEGQS